MSVLENPRLWAYPVIEHFKKRQGTEPQDVRSFMEKMTSQLDQQHGESLCRVGAGESGQLTEEDSQMLQTVIEECLQRVVELPLQARLIDWCKRKCAADDRELIRRQGYLRACEQSFFEIPQHAISPSNWRKACQILSSLEDALNVTPNQRLQILISVKKAIEITYESECKERGADPTKHPLSADEIMPIFTFVVVNSQVTSLKATQMYLYEIAASGCHGLGEAGYYLCVLEASVGHVLAMDMADAEQEYHRKAREALENRRLQQQEELESQAQNQAVIPLQAECPKCGTTLWVKALITNVCGACEHKFYVKKPRGGAPS